MCVRACVRAYVRACVRACVRVRVCLSVCLSVASDISETSEAITTTFDTVTASVRRMHHVLITLTLTFIQGHTYFNHKNNKYLIISETIQAMPIRFAVKIVRLKVYVTVANPITLTSIQGHTCVSNLTIFNLQYIGQCLCYDIQNLA